MREKDRKDRYRAECGGRTDEELSALLESPDAPALLRDAAREVLDSRAEWKAAEQRRRAKETEREQESKPQSTAQRGTHFGASVLRERRPYHSRAARDERDGFARYSGHKRRKRASRVEPWSIAMLHP